MSEQKDFKHHLLRFADIYSYEGMKLLRYSGQPEPDRPLAAGSMSRSKSSGGVWICIAYALSFESVTKNVTLRNQLLSQLSTTSRKTHLLDHNLICMRLCGSPVHAWVFVHNLKSQDVIVIGGDNKRELILEQTTWKMTHKPDDYPRNIAKLNLDGDHVHNIRPDAKKDAFFKSNLWESQSRRLEDVFVSENVGLTWVHSVARQHETVERASEELRQTCWRAQTGMCAFCDTFTHSPDGHGVGTMSLSHRAMPSGSEKTRVHSSKKLANYSVPVVHFGTALDPNDEGVMPCVECSRMYSAAHKASGIVSFQHSNITHADEVAKQCHEFAALQLLQAPRPADIVRLCQERLFANICSASQLSSVYCIFTCVYVEPHPSSNETTILAYVSNLRESVTLLMRIPQTTSAFVNRMRQRWWQQKKMQTQSPPLARVPEQVQLFSSVGNELQTFIAAGVVANYDATFPGVLPKFSEIMSSVQQVSKAEQILQLKKHLASLVTFKALRDNYVFPQIFRLLYQRLQVQGAWQTIASNIHTMEPQPPVGGPRTYTFEAFKHRVERHRAPVENCGIIKSPPGEMQHVSVLVVELPKPAAPPSANARDNRAAARNAVRAAQESRDAAAKAAEAAARDKHNNCVSLHTSRYEFRHPVLILIHQEKTRPLLHITRKNTKGNKIVDLYYLVANYETRTRSHTHIDLSYILSETAWVLRATSPRAHGSRTPALNVSGNINYNTAGKGEIVSCYKLVETSQTQSSLRLCSPHARRTAHLMSQQKLQALFDMRNTGLVSDHLRALTMTTKLTGYLISTELQYRDHHTDVQLHLPIAKMPQETQHLLLYVFWNQFVIDDAFNDKKQFSKFGRSGMVLQDDIFSGFVTRFDAYIRTYTEDVLQQRKMHLAARGTLDRNTFFSNLKQAS